MIKTLFNASAINFLGALTSYSIVVFLAQLGSDGAYAEFLYMLTWALLIGSFIDFAGESVFVKYARHVESLVEAFSLLFSLKVIGFLTVIILFFSTNNFFNLLDFKFLFLMLPIFHLGTMFEYLNKNLTYVLVLFFEKLILFFFLYYVTKGVGFSDSVFYVYLIVNLFSILLQFSILRAKISFVRKNLFINFIEYTKLYYPMFFVLQLHLIYGYYTRLIIESRNGIEAFASVAIALQIINIASLFQSQVDRTFRSPIFEAIEAKSRKSFIQATKKYLFFTTFPIILGCCLLYLIADFIGNTLFPEGYSGLVICIKILSIAPFSVNMIRLGDAIFTGMHNTKINMLITFLAVVLLVINTLLLNNASTESYLLVLIVVQFLHGIVSVVTGIIKLLFKEFRVI